jgi:hypothetical protein
METLLGFLLLGHSKIESVKKLTIHSMSHEWSSFEIKNLFQKYPKLEKLRINLEYKDAEQMRTWFQEVKINGPMMKRFSIGLFVPVDPKVRKDTKRSRTETECDGTINKNHY